MRNTSNRELQLWVTGTKEPSLCPIWGCWFIKVLDVYQLLKRIRETGKRLHSLGEQVQDLKKRVMAVVTLDDSFRGKGAQAIRSFYKELHLPFLLFLEGFIADYQDVLKGMESELLAMEPDENGYIHQEFLEGDLVDGLKKAEQMTTALTDETNAAIKSIRDIVSLPTVDDEEFLFTLTQGRSQIYETVEKLHAYDADQTAKLEHVEHDIQVMKQYLQKINEKQVSGDLSIAGYSVKQLSGVDAYDELLKGLKGKRASNAFSRDNLMTYGVKGFLTRFLNIPIPGAVVKYAQKKFEMRTMDYSLRSMQTLLDIGGSSIS
ncbi:ribonuclease YeeF family protein [Lentibacillus daqui]|uniref:ribonuclease YeeF family protein n=1 Tax=Lentibacillus daqui TaxID=2911514 RepID=UPI0034E2E98C